MEKQQHPTEQHTGRASRKGEEGGRDRGENKRETTTTLPTKNSHQKDQVDKKTLKSPTRGGDLVPRQTR